ncbi:hypothetical protein RF11_10722 [Thelohanellus kitauei]|uniref:Uncharacterized protein n=1 Tax=Thelohanellus kitauei TaxID=669202 RepID=A0A0C2MPT6_THEKT|nr:hypothetical protein RF11_10722 [Thelohanellus kitauei]
MKSKKYREKKANKKAIKRYNSGTQSDDVLIQIQAIRKFMSHFLNQEDSATDEVFIANFPNQLYEDFNAMSKGQKKLDRYHEKQTLLFDMFTYIFRNHNLLLNFKAQSFAKLFLGFMRYQDPDIIYDPSKIMDSINNFISQDPNKIVLINENGMFHFLCNFHLENGDLKQRFWSMCKNIYELNHQYKEYFSSVKLAECVNQIMNKYFSYGEEDVSKFLIMVLKLVEFVDLLDHIKLDVTMFFRITEKIFSNKPQKRTEKKLNIDIIKICKAMLNGSINPLRIESIEQLVTASSVFSFGLARKLKKTIRDKRDIQMTKNVKHSLYIIYFSLIAFPLIDQNSKNRLRPVLLELHRLFQNYFKKCSIKKLSIDSQFQMIQYYVKSSVTLRVDFSPHDHHIINEFLDNLHSNFMFTHLLFDISFDSTSGESNLSSNLNKINRYLNNLISSLSDEEYINKLQEQQKLDHNENVKSIYIRIFSEDLIARVFTRCESYLLDKFKDESPEVVGSDAYAIYNNVMMVIVRIFNDSNYLEKSIADSLKKLNDEFSSESLPTSSDVVNSDNVADTSIFSTISSYVDSNGNHPFKALFRWFTLIYEFKFIFGDINCKFTKMNLI